VNGFSRVSKRPAVSFGWRRAVYAAPFRGDEQEGNAGIVCAGMSGNMEGK